MVRIYNTHMELYPYKKGQNKSLEKLMSVHNGYKFVPFILEIKDNTLYIPRGFALHQVFQLGDDIPMVMNEHDPVEKVSHNYMMVKEPITQIERDAIDFLTCQGQFLHNVEKNQFALNLDTGYGKTYCAVNSILALKDKAMVITHKLDLRHQWVEKFEEYTNVPEERLCEIVSPGHNGVTISEILKEDFDTSKYDYYFTCHTTIRAYASHYGWDKVHEMFKKLGIGIKVIDEQHLCFKNTLLIDFYTNTKRSFYLTATSGRSDYKENKLFKKAFANAATFGETTYDYDEHVLHTNFIAVYFNSKPKFNIPPKVQTYKGFSALKYIDYEFKTETEGTLIKVLDRILDQTRHMKGKTLIISPRKDTVVFIKNFIQSKFGPDEKVGTVYSDNTEAEKEFAKTECRYISSTLKSMDAGDDIENLRIIINLTPIGSRILFDQLRGRLRRFKDNPDKETYLYYPVDNTLPDMSRMLNRIIPVMKKKCKSILRLNWSDL